MRTLETVAEIDQDDSILDVKRVYYEDDGKLTVLPYMHELQMLFYVVVNNVREWPRVMDQYLRHWIEVASTIPCH